MNYRLVSKLLGVVALLIGGFMVFSLPFAIPLVGYRNHVSAEALAGLRFEAGGFVGLLGSILLCGAVGGALSWWGRGSKGRLYRKEAMAVVGLSWILATILGAVPFLFSGTQYTASVRITDSSAHVFRFQGLHWREQWTMLPPLSDRQAAVILDLLDAGAKGRDPNSDAWKTLADGTAAEVIGELVNANRLWADALITPDERIGPADRISNFRLRWVRMGVADALFESQSGFSTTGATVISDLEDPALVPHCILFWRASTHFLGGLGIIVLFVVILGQGSAGKALMRAEMPGPTKEGSHSRMQHTAWVFAGMYCGLNVVLAVILWLLGLSVFDALCHAFGTLATGGFSNYNSSLGHYDSAVIEFVVIAFMGLAGTNFTLLFYLLCFQPDRLLADVEWRTYMAVIVGVTFLVVVFGLYAGDFGTAADAIRYGLFQVVSILTTTGFGTHDFDNWNSFGRGVLFLLMFVGGCAGSTGGGLKVIRHVLFVKILRLEIEQAFHPSVVRPLRLGGVPVESEDLRKNILVYFGLILAIFVYSWMFLVTVEPDATWGGQTDHKLIDSASGVSATLNNIGPGLGTVGATKNYGHFSPIGKVLFVWLMMIGRLEIFSILVLFTIGFWRTR